MILKTENEKEGLRTAGRKLASALKAVERLVSPGVVTSVLDDEAQRVIREEKARPSFLGYKGYPAALCVSINDEIVHGIPSTKKVLHEGDIVGLDLGLVWQGYFVDMAVTVAVGTVSKPNDHFLHIPEGALAHAITVLHAGMTVGDLGAEIQAFIENAGGVVIRDLVGHGVGKAIHEDPPIPNFGTKGTGPMLREGEVIAVEPMVSISSAHTKTDGDGWTVRTDNGSLASHFEHTLIVGKDGVEVVTQV